MSLSCDFGQNTPVGEARDAAHAFLAQVQADQGVVVSEGVRGLVALVELVASA
ncbi:hypothetical protein ACFYVL_01170 [Streptomyces sp. NPDC004111]|uniref:hypothetical protein n=1 Tax=Streptomyces sp. NPDC004111 TaxID=3364690 RepID=UPI0036C407B7